MRCYRFVNISSNNPRFKGGVPLTIHFDDGSGMVNHVIQPNKDLILYFKPKSAMELYIRNVLSIEEIDDSQLIQPQPSPETQVQPELQATIIEPIAIIEESPDQPVNENTENSQTEVSKEEIVKSESEIETTKKKTRKDN